MTHHPPWTAEPMTCPSSPSVLPMPLKSSASSVTNLDLNEGILVHDLDPDVDTTPSEDTAVGHVHDIASDESRRNLRDHLRRTLSVQRDKSGHFFILRLCI